MIIGEAELRAMLKVWMDRIVALEDVVGDVEAVLDEILGGV